QERKFRARRRLAAIAVVVFVAVVTIAVSALWKRSAPDGPVVMPAEMSAAEPLREAPAAESPSAKPSAEEPEAVTADMEDEMQAMAIPETAETETVEFWGPPDPFNRITGSLQSGQTLGQLFDEMGVPAGTAQKIIQT